MERKHTYSLSLQFGDEVNEIIDKVERAIREITKDEFRSAIPPHITIASFRAEEERQGELLEIAERVCEKIGAFEIEFTEIGDFKERSLFLKAQKSEILSKLNSDINNIFLKKGFEVSQNGLYLPENFFPHLTLATKVNKKFYSQVLTEISKIELPLVAKSNAITVFQHNPIKKLTQIQLEPTFF